MKLMITGAANGIGAATVEAALAAGHSVIAADQDAAGLARRWGNMPQVITQTLDVRDAQAWQQAMQAAGELDVLINVAGVLRPGRTGELSVEEVNLQIDVNVKGVIFGTNAAAAQMAPRGQGHIVNVGSTASLYPTPGNTVYAASKHAVRGFSIAAAGDLKAKGVAVSLVGPTAVRTDMLELQRSRDESALTFSGKRALSAAEVASAIINKVLKDKPLEIYLPSSEAFAGKLMTLMPGLFLKNVERFRARGVKNVKAGSF